MKDFVFRIPRPAFAVFAALHAGFITLLSSCPGDKLPGKGFLVSWFYNLLHAPVFAILAVFVALALGERRETTDSGRSIEWSLARVVGSIAIVLGFGVVDEWHQSFVAKRSSDPVDLITDTLGSIVAVLLLRIAFSAGDAAGRNRRWVGVAACAALAALNAAFASLPR